MRVDHTLAREIVEIVSSHSASESSVAGYAEATWRPVDRLRVLAGLRQDFYDFEARARATGLLSGGERADITSPKIGIAWQLSDEVELYGNWGRGFHSNDARGVTVSDPPVPGLVRGQGYEGGARFQRGTFSCSLAYWWLEVGSELKFVGDSNSVEPGAASRRRGYERVGFWRPVPWLAFDAVWTETRARYDDSPGADFIPGAVEDAGELGVSAIYGPWEASIRLRHLGPYPLVEDDSLRADAEDTVNTRVAWRSGNLMLYGELLNVFDSDGKDIVYWYEAYLPAIDAEPTEGRMSRATEPRTVRVGIRYEFAQRQR